MRAGPSIAPRGDGRSPWRQPILVSLALALGPAAVVYVVLKVTSDADEGANIGGGLLVMGVLMLGCVMAVIYLAMQSARIIRGRRC